MVFLWPAMAEVTGTADRQGFLRNANSGRFASLATERCTGTARWGDLVESHKNDENVDLSHKNDGK